MAGKQKKARNRPKREQRARPAPAPKLDPETGLPPVGQAMPDEMGRIVRQARAKHAHKLGPRR